MKVAKLAALAELVPGADDALPTEFRLFKYGANPNTKGTAVFDEEAAASVMASAAERGQVDFPIDLEHKSLDATSVALTRDATDALGWFALELRPDGLYATNVRWTPEGAERLRAKKQRYVSPAFYWLNDQENGKVGEMINVGLVAMPALHDQAPLVAASRLASVSDATRERAKQILHRAKLRASVSHAKAGK